MALVSFGYTVDMLTIDPPVEVGAYIVAYDLDGLLKQKDHLGSITLVGSGAVGSQGGPGPVGPGGLTWSGLWSATASYSQNYAVGYGSASWWCVSNVTGTTSNVGPDLDTTHWALLATQGSPGSQGAQGFMGPQGVPGPLGFRWLGDWIINVYDPRDTVYYNGSSYVCILSTIGYETLSPDNNPTCWFPIALMGETGMIGSTGSQGLPGTSGTSGSSGTSGAIGPTGPGYVELFYSMGGEIAATNSTSSIYRTGSISIGSASVSGSRFNVSSTTGTSSFIVDENGSIYNGGDLTSLKLGYNALLGIHNIGIIDWIENGGSDYIDNVYTVTTYLFSGAPLKEYPVIIVVVNSGIAYMDSVVSLGSGWIYNGSTILTADIPGGSGYQVNFNIQYGYNIAFGFNSLYSNTTGNSNIALGFNSLYSNTTGNGNIAIGYQSLSNNISSTNTAIGVSSLYSNTTGYRNTAIGAISLYSNTTGAENTALGINSLNYNTTGSSNIAIGNYSLNYNTTGTANTALGFESLYNLISGGNNTAVGYVSLFSTTTGTSNTAIGLQSLHDNTIGSCNTAVGLNSGALISGTTSGATNSNNSVFIGYETRPQADDQTNQIVIGYGATGNGSNTVTLGNNDIVKTYLKGSVLVGAGTGTASDGRFVVSSSGGTVSFVVTEKGSVYNNTNSSFFGYQSLYNLTSGSNNTAFGNYSLNKVTIGSNNTAFGYSALNNLTSVAISFGNLVGGTGYIPGTYSNVTLIYSSGSTATTYPTTTIIVGPGGTVSSVAIIYPNNGTGFKDINTFLTASASSIGGTGSGFSIRVTGIYTSANNTAIGASSLYSNITGLNNTSVGYQSLYSNTAGNHNNALGYQSLYSNTTGTYNTAIGYQSLYSNTTGTYNTAIGPESLYYNTTGGYNVALGYQSGKYTSDGSLNSISNSSIFIGYDVRSSNTNNTNEIVIGSYMVGNGSNSVTLGSNFITKTILKGNIGVGLTGPSTKLHIYATQSGAFRLQDGTQGFGKVLISDSNGVGTWATASFSGATTSGTASITENVVGGKNRILFNSATNSTTTSANLAWDGSTLSVNGSISSNSLGIGTASPSTKLHIYATQSGAFRLQDGTQNSGYVLTSDVNGFATWTLPTSSSSHVYANTLFVDPSGDDVSAIQGRIDLPWLTIGAALLYCESNTLVGYTIWVFPGDYEEISWIFENSSDTTIKLNGGVRVLFTSSDEFAVQVISNCSIIGDDNALSEKNPGVVITTNKNDNLFIIFATLKIRNVYISNLSGRNFVLQGHRSPILHISDAYLVSSTNNIYSLECTSPKVNIINTTLISGSITDVQYSNINTLDNIPVFGEIFPNGIWNFEGVKFVSYGDSSLTGELGHIISSASGTNYMYIGLSNCKFWMNALNFWIWYDYSTDGENLLEILGPSIGNSYEIYHGFGSVINYLGAPSSSIYVNTHIIDPSIVF